MNNLSLICILFNVNIDQYTEQGAMFDNENMAKTQQLHSTGIQCYRSLTSSVNPESEDPRR